MKRPSNSALVALWLCGSTFAARIEDEKRAVTGSAFSSLISKIDAATSIGQALSAMASATPTTSPTAISQVISTLSSIHAASPTNIFAYSAELIANGLVTDNIATIEGYLENLGSENSDANVNTRSPATPIYPKKSPSDAPYSVSQASLRAAIYIPSNFTYGKIPPVILFPGTGSTGYLTFVGNFIPLTQGSSFADPVWVNVPGYLLGDAQVNAEYAAYAINYIAGITGKNVTVVGWSQGNIDNQWAFKYWPSTRNVTHNHIAISPDYDGTTNADFMCLNGANPCTPSVLQQQYATTSKFITTLRSNGGDSAYVPTTTLYSGVYDEIVEPQQGTTASAYLGNANGVAVTNNEVQLFCPGQPAGSFYTHESMLFNPLSYALFRDALANGGPGETSRLDLTTVCAEFAAPGLNLADVLLTESTIPVAAVAIDLYQPKVSTEPPIMAYAA